MFIKVVSIVLAICILLLTMLATQSSTDPLFLFISNNPLVMLVRAALVAALITLAFKAGFKYRAGFHLSTVTATILLSVGIVGLMSQTVVNAFADYIKILDFLFMVQAGITFLLASLTFQTANQEFRLKQNMQKYVPVAKVSRNTRSSVTVK